MDTYAELLAFVKRQRRIPSADTQYDQVITDDLNSAYETYCRKIQVLGAPNMRVVGTPLTIVGGTQNYALPANFDRLIDQSVQYVPANSTWGNQILSIVTGPDAEIWEALSDYAYYPQACRVVAATSPALSPLNLRLLPYFTVTTGTIAFSYWKKPALLTTGVTMEMPQLADAVAWNAVSNSYDYFRDSNAGNSQERADARARESYKQALGLLTS